LWQAVDLVVRTVVAVAVAEAIENHLELFLVVIQEVL